MRGLTSATRIVSALLLLLGGVVFSLVLCEIGLRVAGVSYPVFDDFDALRGVRLRPGKEGWYRGEGESYLRINSLGYRDVEHTLAKPENTFRVAVIGDSFAEARQVDIKDTFWTHIQRSLAACPALNGQKVEVLNFGIGGYATAEELLTFQKDAVRFSPSLVLLAFFAPNDVHDNSRSLSQSTDWRMPKPTYVYSNGELVLDSSFRIPVGRQLLYRSVHYFRLMEVFNQARRVWGQRNIRPENRSDQVELGTYHKVYLPPDDDAWREAWQVTEGLLSRFNDAVHTSGAKFMVTTITAAEQVDPDPKRTADLARRLGVADLRYPERRLAEMGGKHRFPVVTLAEPLQQLAIRDHVYLHGFKNTMMGEGHWNERGHAAGADVLSREICRNTLAPASGADTAKKVASSALTPGQ